MTLREAPLHSQPGEDAADLALQTKAFRTPGLQRQLVFQRQSSRCQAPGGGLWARDMVWLQNIIEQFATPSNLPEQPREVGEAQVCGRRARCWLTWLGGGGEGRRGRPWEPTPPTSTPAFSSTQRIAWGSHNQVPALAVPPVRSISTPAQSPGCRGLQDMRARMQVGRLAVTGPPGPSITFSTVGSAWVTCL